MKSSNDLIHKLHNEKTDTIEVISNRTSREEDEHIIKEILSGNVNKFSVLQKKYYFLVFSLVKKMISDNDDAEDIMQESFVKAYKSLHTYSFDYAFASWLYKITSNNCIDFIRKKRALTPILHKYDLDDDFDIADNSYLPDINLISKEKTIIIKKAIDSLPKKYRDVIIPKYEDDHDYQTISELLNMPLGTVKVTLFRARKMLELILRKYPDIFNL